LELDLIVFFSGLKKHYYYIAIHTQKLINPVYKTCKFKIMAFLFYLEKSSLCNLWHLERQPVAYLDNMAGALLKSARI